MNWRLEVKQLFIALILVLAVSANIIEDDVQQAQRHTSLNSGTGLLLLIVIIFCAVFAAIGGASLFLPLLIIFYSFGPHLANSHAAALILASSIARLFYDSSKNSNRAAINYRLVLLSLPATSLGVLAGSYLNELTPSLCLFVVIVVVLCVLLFVSVVKLIKYIKQKLQDAQADDYQPERDVKIESMDEDEIEVLIVPFKDRQGNRQREEVEYGSDDRPLKDTRQR